MAYVGTPIDTTNQFQSLVGKRFSGDASTTAFTLDVAPTSTLDIEVFVENVRTFDIEGIAQIIPSLFALS